VFVRNDEIEDHLAEHGIMPEEFESVACDPDYVTTSRSTGRTIAFGETAVLPVTAYEPEE
jgi:hypothetical protein